MAEQWTHVRVRKSTHAQLQALADTWDRWYAAGNAAVPDAAEQITLDRVIRVLLERDEAHRARARKAKGKRGKTRQEGAADPGDGAG